MLSASYRAGLASCSCLMTIAVRIVALVLLVNTFSSQKLWLRGPDVATMKQQVDKDKLKCDKQATGFQGGSWPPHPKSWQRQVPEMSLFDVTGVLPEWCDEDFLYTMLLYSLGVLILWPYGHIASAAAGTCARLVAF